MPHEPCYISLRRSLLYRLCYVYSSTTLQQISGKWAALNVCLTQEAGDGHAFMKIDLMELLMEEAVVCTSYIWPMHPCKVQHMVYFNGIFGARQLSALTRAEKLPSSSAKEQSKRTAADELVNQSHEVLDGTSLDRPSLPRWFRGHHRKAEEIFAKRHKNRWLKNLADDVQRRADHIEYLARCIGVKSWAFAFSQRVLKIKDPEKLNEHFLGSFRTSLVPG